MDGTKSVKNEKNFPILVPNPEDDKDYACVNTCQFLPQKHLRVFADVMQLLQIIHLEALCDSFYINGKNVLSCLSFLLNFYIKTY
jgi:hypothetical protein